MSGCRKVSVSTRTCPSEHKGDREGVGERKGGWVVSDKLEEAMWECLYVGGGGGVRKREDGDGKPGSESAWEYDTKGITQKRDTVGAQ